MLQNANRKSYNDVFSLNDVFRAVQVCRCNIYAVFIPGNVTDSGIKQCLVGLEKGSSLFLDEYFESPLVNHKLIIGGPVDKRVVVIIDGLNPTADVWRLTIFPIKFPPFNSLFCGGSSSPIVKCQACFDILID